MEVRKETVKEMEEREVVVDRRTIIKKYYQEPNRELSQQENNG